MTGRAAGAAAEAVVKLRHARTSPARPVVGDDRGRVFIVQLV